MSVFRVFVHLQYLLTRFPHRFRSPHATTSSTLTSHYIPPVAPLSPDTRQWRILMSAYIVTHSLTHVIHSSSLEPFGFQAKHGKARTSLVIIVC